VRQQPELDLRVVEGDEDATGRGHEGAAEIVEALEAESDGEYTDDDEEEGDDDGEEDGVGGGGVGDGGASVSEILGRVTEGGEPDSG